MSQLNIMSTGLLVFLILQYNRNASFAASISTSTTAAPTMLNDGEQSEVMTRMTSDGQECVCVPYYQCNEKGKINKFGVRLLDQRLGEPACESFQPFVPSVCCLVPGYNPKALKPDKTPEDILALFPAPPYNRPDIFPIQKPVTTSEEAIQALTTPIPSPFERPQPVPDLFPVQKPVVHTTSQPDVGPQVFPTIQPNAEVVTGFGDQGKVEVISVPDQQGVVENGSIDQAIGQIFTTEKPDAVIKGPDYQQKPSIEDSPILFPVDGQVVDQAYQHPEGHQGQHQPEDYHSHHHLENHHGHHKQPESHQGHQHLHPQEEPQVDHHQRPEHHKGTVGDQGDDDGWHGHWHYHDQGDHFDAPVLYWYHGNPHMPTGKRHCGHPPMLGVRLNGGQADDLPWLVRIWRQGRGPQGLEQGHVTSLGPRTAICGGSLILENVVLTAAHCVASARDRRELLTVSTTRQGGQEATVWRAVLHPDYDPSTLHYDTALLFLSDPILLGQEYGTGTVCLPPPPAEDPMMKPKPIFVKECFATGFGQDWNAHSVRVPLVEQDTCQNQLRTTRLGSYFELHHSFLCAGGEKGRDTCKGDGGAPLLCTTILEDDTVVTQLGHVSWGIGCSDKLPGIYSAAAHVRPWIDHEVTIAGMEPTLYHLPDLDTYI